MDDASVLFATLVFAMNEAALSNGELIERLRVELGLAAAPADEIVAYVQAALGAGRGASSTPARSRAIARRAASDEARPSPASSASGSRPRWAADDSDDAISESSATPARPARKAAFVAALHLATRDWNAPVPPRKRGRPEDAVQPGAPPTLNGDAPRERDLSPRAARRQRPAPDGAASAPRPRAASPSGSPARAASDTPRRTARGPAGPAISSPSSPGRHRPTAAAAAQRPRSSPSAAPGHGGKRLPTGGCGRARSPGGRALTSHRPRPTQRSRPASTSFPACTWTRWTRRRRGCAPWSGPAKTARRVAARAREAARGRSAQRTPLAAQVLIHFLGWNKRWDEWIHVQSKRLAPEGTQASDE